MPRFLERIYKELAIFAGNRAFHKDNNPCEYARQGELPPGSIPGLDANLCRCPACRATAKDGIWWFDPPFRERVRKKEYPYRNLPRAGGLGDVNQQEEK